MYKYILENAGDISNMALVPLVLFFIVFAGSLVYALVMNTKEIEKLSHLPFEDTLSELEKTKSNHERDV